MTTMTTASDDASSAAVRVDVASPVWLNKIAKEKTALLEELFAMEPLHVEVKDPKTKQPRPRTQGEHIIALWDELYANDPLAKSIVVETVTGPSTPGRDYYDDHLSSASSSPTPAANPAMPYQQLRALVGDGGKWKWPDIWKSLDLLPRRGRAWRHADDPSNLGGKIVNPNPNIVVPLNCLVVGGGPVGLRLAIELVLGGHRVTVWEKRREVLDQASGRFCTLGFTNRINRPHINNFCRNDLDRLNGRNFMTPKMCYPVFTNAHTSSIGIDELQMLLLKTALLVGVQFNLGVGYETAVVDIAPENQRTNQRPSWMVTYSADDIAVERYNLDKSGAGQQRFDALFGCDGGNSRVRKTQVEWLGEPQTRTYKKMFGIVSNLRKCSRAKLKELGFSRGLEPEDMAGLQTGIYFYKASYHNYFIVHPSKEEMEANGIPWKAIFTFDKARPDGTTNNTTTQQESKEQERLKSVLKRYMTQKAKSVCIPIDETAENDGFVSPPNDVMGFDFSQFYNCEKSAAAYVPPLDWDVSRDGDWEIHCPLVALAGDSVSDPNWLLGVGLQRGWNSAMDACFYADNLYNNLSFNGRPPLKKEPIESPIEWSQHLDNMMSLMQTLGGAAREGKLSSEMDMGTLDERGPVVLQIKRKLQARNIEPSVPAYVPNVEPWGRYKNFEFEVKKNYKGKDLFENEHPLAARELAIFSYNERYVERAAFVRNSVTRPKPSMLTWAKRFECSAFWGMMPLLEIDGKLAPGAKGPTSLSAPSGGAGDDLPPNTTKPAAALAGDAVSAASNASSLPVPPNPEEVKEMAQLKSNRLHENIVTVAMNGPSGHHHSTAEETLANIIFKKTYTPASKAPPHEAMEHDAAESASATSTIPQKLSATPKRIFPSATTESRKSVHLANQNPTSGGAASADHPDALIILSDLERKTLQYEKQILLAKLNHAQAEVTKVAYEQKALEAKMNHAKVEVDMIQHSLRAYEEAEASLAEKERVVTDKTSL